MATAISPNLKAELVVLPQFKPFFLPKKGLIVSGGRSRGASTAMAQAVTYFGSMCKMRIAVCREFQNSIEESAKAEIEKWIASDPLIESQWIITRSYLMHRYTLSTIIFRGLQRNKKSIKGLSDIDLCIVEEADSMSWESWELLSPTIRKLHSETWLVGNNGKKSTPFGTLVQDPPKGWLSVVSTYLDNPYNTHDTLDKALYCLKTQGQAVYNNIWLGAWEDAAQMRLINVLKFDTGDLPPPRDDTAVHIGVDIARTGDKTVIAVRQGKRFPEILEYQTMDLPALTGILQTLIRRYRPTGIWVDSTGHGAWVPDGLRQSGVHVESVVFSERAQEDDRYHNRRTELYGRMGRYMQDGGTIPNRRNLVEDLEASFYDWDSRNRPQLHSKDEIRSTLGRSTDEGDACCLTLAGPETQWYTDPSKGLTARVKQAQVNQTLANMGRWRS